MKKVIKNILITALILLCLVGLCYLVQNYPEFTSSVILSIWAVAAVIGLYILVSLFTE